MGKQTSVHYNAVKSNSEKHNSKEERERLDYVRDELSHLNESWKSHSIEDVRSMIEISYQGTVGQKMQSHAEPIKEAVIVIKEDTTMSDLKALADDFKKEWGIETFQINIHKDEGHFDDNKKWVPNYHAHFVSAFNSISRGRSLKVPRTAYSKMQDKAAFHLGMERGTPSNKSHLDPQKYKAVIRRQKSLKKALNEFKGVKAAIKIAKGELIDLAAELYAELDKANNDNFNLIKKGEEAQKTIEETDFKLSEIKKEYNLRSQVFKETTEKLEKLEVKIKRLEKSSLQDKELIKKYEEKLGINKKSKGNNLSQ